MNKDLNTPQACRYFTVWNRVQNWSNYSKWGN